jgi:hypothetical protein
MIMLLSSFAIFIPPSGGRQTASNDIQFFTCFKAPLAPCVHLCELWPSVPDAIKQQTAWIAELRYTAIYVLMSYTHLWVTGGLSKAVKWACGCHSLPFAALHVCFFG